MTDIQKQHIDQWFEGPTESPLLIAGPCSVESPEQVLQTARELHQYTPLSALRGGVWKPRTKPGSFEGIGEAALDWLVDAGKDIGVPVTTEVANADHVEKALKAGIDILWIGARTTVNPFYVQEIADALRGVDVPVFVKNPIHAEVGLWAGAIERFSAVGVKHVAAVHRGFFSSTKNIWRNEPQWQHSFELRAMLPDTKIIVDPSHIAGDRKLVQEVCQTAMDLGMDGLMVESHWNPDQAKSDAAQQVTPEALGRIISELKVHQSAPLEVSNEELEVLRKSIDILDDQVVNLLKERFKLVREVAEIKEREGMSIFRQDRWIKLVRERMEQGDQSISAEFMHELFSVIHKHSVNYQSTLVKKHD
ncbi:MAG: hypothetical protein RL754_870 [Bacteroidota bacterium]|jgi:chorismate mutase